MKALTTILVQLLDDAVDCWRPVEAELVAEGQFKIISIQPEDKKWKFQTGETVRCAQKQLSDGNFMVAVEKFDTAV